MLLSTIYLLARLFYRLILLHHALLRIFCSNLLLNHHRGTLSLSSDTFDLLWLYIIWFVLWHTWYHNWVFLFFNFYSILTLWLNRDAHTNTVVVLLLLFLLGLDFGLLILKMLYVGSIEIFEVLMLQLILNAMLKHFHLFLICLFLCHKPLCRWEVYFIVRWAFNSLWHITSLLQTFVLLYFLFPVWWLLLGLQIVLFDGLSHLWQCFVKLLTFSCYFFRRVTIWIIMILERFLRWFLFSIIVGWLCDFNRLAIFWSVFVLLSLVKLNIV